MDEHDSDWQHSVTGNCVENTKNDSKFIYIFTRTVTCCADECRSNMMTHFHWLMQPSNYTDEQQGTPHFSEMSETLGCVSSSVGCSCFNTSCRN